MANKKFGDTLRTLRNNKGYTQQEVADILGLKNKSTLGSWEVGKSEPDAYTFLKLLKIYDVDDVYGAFDEVSPKQPTNDIAEKYNQLHSGYRKLIENQITQLLELQDSDKSRK